MASTIALSALEEPFEGDQQRDGQEVSGINLHEFLRAGPMSPQV